MARHHFRMKILARLIAGIENYGAQIGEPLVCFLREVLQRFLSSLSELLSIFAPKIDKAKRDYTYLCGQMLHARKVLSTILSDSTSLSETEDRYPSDDPYLFFPRLSIVICSVYEFKVQRHEPFGMVRLRVATRI